MAERGVNIDHATLNRWVVRYAPQIADQAQRRKRRTLGSWRIDETYRAPRPLFRRDAYDWNAREERRI